jgi:replication-associated recombination protein RarA
MAKTTQSGVLGVDGALAMQRRLLRYLQGGRVHQAILLTGPDVSLKLDIGKAIARFLLCKNPENNNFCGECSNCRRIEKEIHPDVVILREPEEDTIKIETIREVTHQMGILPLEGEKKVCLIDECHRMNQAASNAFLKTLEEPGAGRYFLLMTTQPGSLLPTLLSRMVQFPFKPETELPLEDETETAEFSSLFQKFLEQGNPMTVTSALTEKDRTLRFLQFLETQLRGATLSGKTALPSLKNLPQESLTEKFHAVLDLEGRLRSNASYALMLEDLLRQHFSQPLRN